jgi:DNA-directed RNA polymerase specialized sigma24 family protein
MASEGSITRLIYEMRAGNSAAADGLWQHFFPQLIEVARRKLRGCHGLVDDEEDVALSAMNRFFRAAQQGRYPSLADRNALWCLLLQITNHRVLNLHRDETRQRRGGGRVGGAVAASAGGSPNSHRPEMPVRDDVPTPEFASMMADECRRLLELLDDAELRTIAVAKMEGYTNAEIASQLNRSERTVERRLRLIRDRWKLEWERAGQESR